MFNSASKLIANAVISVLLKRNVEIDISRLASPGKCDALDDLSIRRNGASSPARRYRRVKDTIVLHRAVVVQLVIGGERD